MFLSWWSFWISGSIWRRMDFESRDWIILEISTCSCACWEVHIGSKKILFEQLFTWIMKQSSGQYKTICQGHITGRGVWGRPGYPACPSTTTWSGRPANKNMYTQLKHNNPTWECFLFYPRENSDTHTLYEFCVFKVGFRFLGLKGSVLSCACELLGNHIDFKNFW